MRRHAVGRRRHRAARRSGTARPSPSGSIRCRSRSRRGRYGGGDARGRDRGTGRDHQLDVTVTDADGAPVRGCPAGGGGGRRGGAGRRRLLAGRPARVVLRQPRFVSCTRCTAARRVVLADPTTARCRGTGRERRTRRPQPADDDGRRGEPATPTPLRRRRRRSGQPHARPTSGAGGAPVADADRTSTPSPCSSPTSSPTPTGRAVVDVPLPDNLTRYRVMVVAVGGRRPVRLDEANITARLPLMVRPSAPRFANFGDSFELPVIVQNQTDTADGGRRRAADRQPDGRPAPAGKRITVPANDRVEVRFPVATESAGTRRFRVVAVSGRLGDAATVTLPVYTPATAEAFATYGVLDDGATCSRCWPRPACSRSSAGSRSPRRRPRCRRSPTLCSTSRSTRTPAPTPWRRGSWPSRRCATCSRRSTPRDCRARRRWTPRSTADIAGLAALQNADGGFPYWERDRRVRAVQQHPGHARPRRRPAPGTRCRRRPSSSLVPTSRRSSSTSIPSTARRSRDTLERVCPVRPDPRGRHRLRQGRTAVVRPRRGAVRSMRSPGCGRSSTDSGNRCRHRAGHPEPRRRHRRGRDVHERLRATTPTCCSPRTRRPTASCSTRCRPSDRRATSIPKVVAGLLGNRTKGRWNDVQDELVRPARAEALLRRGRGARPRLRRSRLAGRSVRGRAELPRPLDRSGRR